jgi:hypothetical protein
MKVHDVMARGSHVLTQVVVQHSTKFSVTQQLDIVPIQIVPDEAPRRLAYRLKRTKYRAISPAH